MLDSAGRTMPELEGHRTSRSPVESIGRWRRELSTELQRAGEEAFGDLLAEFGYDVRSGESRRQSPAVEFGTCRTAIPGPDLCPTTNRTDGDGDSLTD
jgi:hypothetical protein